MKYNIYVKIASIQRHAALFITGCIVILIIINLFNYSHRQKLLVKLISEEGVVNLPTHDVRTYILPDASGYLLPNTMKYRIKEGGIVEFYISENQ